MILVDTSVWIDHSHRGDAQLDGLLATGEIVAHPFVLGELALGGSRSEAALLKEVGNLERAVVAFHEDVMSFIERHKLGGSGIGYVDAHLIVSTRLTRHCRFWTRDRRLRAVASRLDVAFTPP